MEQFGSPYLMGGWKMIVKTLYCDDCGKNEIGGFFAWLKFIFNSSTASSIYCKLHREERSRE